MAAAADLDPLPDRLRRSARRCSLAYGVGERLQVVGLDRFVGRLADRKPDDIPATRRGHPVRVPCAQVVTMRLDKGRQRPEDRRGIPVHVGERVNSHLPAGGPGALPRAQLRTTRAWYLL